ncbi:hypothetical protein [Ensifer aridi]|uniref:hypothetical protein n=1 Tax=Ensifer aridi TaxID=1708715 RepID=UPI001FCD0202|nr:hypothetical protein [Ensifer aridi]
MPVHGDELALLIAERVRRQLPGCHGNLIVDAIVKVEREGGYPLTDAQREAVYMAT